ncbi:LptF/LptG family permease [Halocella sp. SP3-1]|uniref:LptF/LptG family permease n=1 Tax=Halocella sp. SP3-1 TaxID=2382161 RepID=UPI000F754F32|nr:LptF/LptG family permease [Halocella sp. SP3-1]AZO93169.1 YjgP/YjgQ family permease [Halocella sp. SP3-1]
MVSIWHKRIVDKYIIKEVLMPFLVGVTIVGIIMLSGVFFQLTDLIIVKDIPIILVLRLLFYYLPEIMVETFPVAVLFATIYGMSRLSRENEFTALRMGGISLYRLIWPLIILGVIISMMTFIINEEIVPQANHKAQNIIRRSILKQAVPDVKEGVFLKGPEGRIFYVSKYDEKNNTLTRIVEKWRGLLFKYYHLF